MARGRPGAEFTTLSISVTNEMGKRLREMAHTEDITISTVVRRALRQFFLRPNIPNSHTNVPSENIEGAPAEIAV